MARALPLSLLASLLIAEPAFAQANFEGLADNILGLLSNGLLRTLAIIAIILGGLLWFLGRASVQLLATVVVGVVIVFCAPWIVHPVTGGWWLDGQEGVTKSPLFLASTRPALWTGVHMDGVGHTLFAG